MTHFAVKPESIGIIIVNWNGEKDTIACLTSLSKVSYPHIQIFLVDNGSREESLASIHSYIMTSPLQITLIQNKENLGFAEGNNVGIRAALASPVDFIFLLNNDTVVDPHLFEPFLFLYQRFPNAGILGSYLLLLEDRETLDHLGGNWDPKRGEFTLIGLRQKTPWEPPQSIDYVCGAAMMIKREVIERIGLFDPRYFLIWEESDFCFRAKKEGFEIMTCPESKVWHKVSASFTGGKPHSTYFWWRNRLLWIEQHCSFKEKFSLYLRILIPKTLHVLKLYLLRNIQLFFIQFFSLKTPSTQAQEKLKKMRATLTGIRDYCFRRFGNGPSWLFSKNRPEEKEKSC